MTSLTPYAVLIFALFFALSTDNTGTLLSNHGTGILDLDSLGKDPTIVFRDDLFPAHDLAGFGIHSRCEPRSSELNTSLFFAQNTRIRCGVFLANDSTVVFTEDLFLFVVISFGFHSSCKCASPSTWLWEHRYDQQLTTSKA